MNKLILLIMALAITPTAYAEPNRGYFDYYCTGNSLFYCKDIKEGDVLKTVTPDFAVLYCDKDELLLESHKTVGGMPRYTCIYNGRKIKSLNTLETT